MAGRRHEIVTWLDELNADVVCLQEVWQADSSPNSGGWIAEHAVGDWFWEFGGFGRPDPVAAGVDPSRRFGSAINGPSTYFQNAWAVVHDGGGVTWDPANDLAAGFAEPPRRIDYVFVGESYRRLDGAGRVLSASLVFNEPRTGTFASDHYGLCVDIAWPTRPPIPNDRRP